MQIKMILNDVVRYSTGGGFVGLWQQSINECLSGLCDYVDCWLFSVWGETPAQAQFSIPKEEFVSLIAPLTYQT